MQEGVSPAGAEAVGDSVPSEGALARGRQLGPWGCACRPAPWLACVGFHASAEEPWRVSGSGGCGEMGAHSFEGHVWKGQQSKGDPLGGSRSRMGGPLG